MIYPSDSTQIDQLRQAVSNYQPQRVDRNSYPAHVHAAVALLLRQSPYGVEILFILRAEFPGDPWSGNIAFPGGHIENRDKSARDAAERETFEEIGIDLRQEEFLGQLDDVAGAHLPVIVSCFTYYVSRSTPITHNHEISKTFWVQLDSLIDPERQRLHHVTFRGKELTRPAVSLLDSEKTLLWGITYRLVSHFLRLAGRPSLPPTAIP